MKSLTILAVGFCSLTITQADFLPGSLPTVTPFTPGLVSVAYNFALTTQTIAPGSEFVILDVVGFDHWETPSVSYSLSVESVTQGITYFDDPTKQNLRFTYMDLEALTGPQVLNPLSGFIFEETPELIERYANFATHAYQLEEVSEIVSRSGRVSRHAILPIPEASTKAMVTALVGTVGLVWFRRRHP